MRKLWYRSPVSACALSLVVTAAFTGCGSSEPGLVPVKGKITLDGGPFPKEGMINFTGASAADPNAPSRPGSAKFGTDGVFSAMSFEPGDGLYPGTYKLAVECQDAPPTIANDGRMIGGKNLIPAKFQNAETSGLTLTVPADGVKDAVIDVKTK
ncbi:MAG: hypothetical protein ACKO85_22145 [Isosphaeraceae bacterium]